MNYKQIEIRNLTASIETTANDMWQRVYSDLEDKELEDFKIEQLQKIDKQLKKLCNQLPEFIGLPF